MPRPRRYQLVDTCVVFNFDTLFNNIRNDMLTKHTYEEWGEEYFSEFMKNLSTFKLQGQTFKYENVPPYLGGFRFYVLCPKCGERKTRLYLPSKYPDREQCYLCAICHRLRPISQMSHKSKKYREIIRPLKKMELLKKKLLKKRLSKEESDVLLNEYNTLERSLQNSPEYRAWRFSVEHGNFRAASQ